MDHPFPWLKYVDADDVNDDAVDFDGMNVESTGGEHLGVVDGFIVDAESARPFYVVVDAGGWFKSKNFLLPVGHVAFDREDEALVADIARDRIERFPGFDKDNFEKLSAADLKRLNDDICRACGIEGVGTTYAAGEPYDAAWDRPDFRNPDWWHAEPTLPERMGESAITAGASYRQTSSNAAVEKDPSPHFDGRAQPGDVIGLEDRRRAKLRP